jgi:threonine/homoserine/homoserine lactone efflux protein
VECWRIHFKPLQLKFIVSLAALNILLIMSISYFLQGLIIGFAIAAPVGPIGILCIHRTLSLGRKYGFLSGLGAATADAFYGTVAAFGLTIVSGFLIQQQVWLRLVGGLFLCYLGIKTILSKTVKDAESVNPGSYLNAYGSIFLLTLTNPLTILSFAAIFAGIGLVNTHGNYFYSIVTVMGVFLGSATWWFILSTVTSLFRGRIKVSGLIWINRISGLVILGFGIAALATVLKIAF